MRQSELEMSALILAGGASSRMGRDKTWLDVSGKPLIQLAVEKVRELGVREIFISGRREGDYSSLQLPVLFDLELGFGPMAGIERGLRACAFPLLLVMAVDLPHMSSTFLGKMINRCDRLTGVVPKLNGRFEPLAAIYPRRCHAFAFEAIARARRAVQEFVADCLGERAVRPLTVAPSDALCFANWNSPSDLGRILNCSPCNFDRGPTALDRSKHGYVWQNR
ncbi:MAG: molybdenum cofactor guanylyltransferase [Verrucomicrobiia bacterium]